MITALLVDVVSYADIVWIEAVKNYSRVQAHGRPARLKELRRVI